MGTATLKRWPVDAVMIVAARAGTENGGTENMSQKKRRKYLPYVRRANGREQTSTLRDAIRLAFHRLRGRPFYVMVQRGFPNTVIAVARSKRELSRSPLPVATGRMNFGQWAKSIQRYAQREES